MPENSKHPSRWTSAAAIVLYLAGAKRPPPTSPASFPVIQTSAAPASAGRNRKAISNHQNHWYWGPRDYTGATVIVLGSDGEGDRENFKTVDVAGHTFHPYSRRDEHFPILLCRGLIQDLHTVWPSIKKWD